MKWLQPIILFGTLSVFLWMINFNILRAENEIASGTPVYLELAPVDPRSLIQGDYMLLDYAVARDALGVISLTEADKRGQLVARLDENNVATFSHIYEAGEVLAPDEMLLNYRTRNNRVLIGVDSFLFQEGFADEYADAMYAEVRVNAGGGVHLIDLVGENFEALVP